MKMLLVEDQEAQILIMKEAAKEFAHELTLTAVCDGSEATEYLLGHGRYADRNKFPYPDLLVTDLNMPGMDGLGLLRWLRDNPECGAMPKLVLSNSSSTAEINKAYELGANSFLRKPSGISDSRIVLMAIHAYWKNCQESESSSD